MPTLLTLTGDRPEAFRLCKKYVERQTKYPDKWLIIDDGDTPIEEELPSFAHYVRRKKKPSDPVHTLKVNFMEGLKYIDSWPIVIMEDDDWYHPLYFENMCEGLEQCDMLGSKECVYYNVKYRRYRNCHNYVWSSLCETGFNKSTEELMLKLLHARPEFAGLDLEIWKHPKDTLVRHLFYVKVKHCVGIKGLPGRKGLTSGHRPETLKDKDFDLWKLQELIGADYKNYVEFYK